MSSRFWLIVAGLSGAIGVTMGAFGAHGLEKRLVELGTLDAYNVGAQYQMYHTLALLGVAWIADRGTSKSLQAAGWAFLIGNVLFSGSLYVLGVTGIKALGAVTPLGGTAYIVGWVLLLPAARGLDVAKPPLEETASET